mgnify:CR=1 FL=1
MQGTVLILDGVATSRIMLRVQLSAAYYRVVQATALAGVAELVRRTRPDVIACAMNLPDGDAITLRQRLRHDPDLDAIPVIAITEENDRHARIRALEAGIDDVISRPLDDPLLMARVRNLVRSRNNAEVQVLREATGHPLGFSEPAQLFAPPQARVALLTASEARGARWQSDLRTACPHFLTVHRTGDILALLSAPGADAVVLDLGARGERDPLSLMAELKARAVTGGVPVIAVTESGDARAAADALERGADDVLERGFCPQELALRLDQALRRKARSDLLRRSVRNGLRAAVLDPLTGIYNRRYALPHLSRVTEEAQASGARFAVMLADIDHFKQVNDRFGHPVGDAVLVETALRLQSLLRPSDMLARVGGEEFLVVLAHTSPASAALLAERLCREINGRPYRLAGLQRDLPVSISVGLVLGPSGGGGLVATDMTANDLITRADRALYRAKAGGRNKVSTFPEAA